jgi:hypothetical protein
MIKRIISGAMSLIVSCSLLTSVDIFNQKDVVIKNQVDNQISGNEDYNLNSTNSLDRTASSQQTHLRCRSQRSVLLPADRTKLSACTSSTPYRQ